MTDYHDVSRSPSGRARALLRGMTTEEKIGQLCKGRAFDYYSRTGNTIMPNRDFVEFMHRRPFGTLYGVLRADWWTKRDFVNGVTSAIARDSRNRFQKIAVEETRLGIPILFVEEAPHGLMALDATVFPTGLGLGAAFDPELLEQIGRVMGEESAAAGIGSIYAPILDLAIDPRWSRCEECFSEDAFLCARSAEAVVRGIRSAEVEPTLKHYVGGGHAEGGHNTMTAHLGPYELFNRDLRPFRDCIKAGAKIVMSTYHDVDGEPCTGSRWLLTDILRGQLGFDGLVIADGGAVGMLCGCRQASDLKHAAARALKAGCDGESGANTLAECGCNLLDAWNAGLIADADLDPAVGRLLEIKFKLGLFEHPYTDGKPEQVFASAPHREVALNAARESFVLLKNENSILPISSACRSIAVIGPNADHAMNMLGDYTAPQKSGGVITLLDGIRAIAEERGIEVHYAHGCAIRHMDRSGFEDALSIARESDLTVFVPGGSSTRYGNVATDPITGAVLPPEILGDDSCEKESGEGTDRATLCLSGVQPELFRQLAATGKPVVVVPILGRPLLFGEFLEKAAALLCVWYPGMEGGKAIAETLFGRFNPGGKLPVSLPRSEGQLPVNGNSNRYERNNYIDSPGTSLLPFGFGLSYTTFACENLTVDGRTVSLAVRNTGTVPGDEVVQFYLHACCASMLRPERELFGFHRIHLEPGEVRTVMQEIPDEALGFYDRNGDFRLEPGEYRIGAGGNPKNLLSATFWKN